jgi:hypothetical protein
VHGSLRFGLIYELGVVIGALTFVVMDGGTYSLVGCSGGVYCIFGKKKPSAGVLRSSYRLQCITFLVGIASNDIYIF